MLEQVREPHVQLAFPQPNRCVQRGESPEPHIERRKGRARPKLAVLLLKYLDE
jgi:hypothetical protein